MNCKLSNFVMFVVGAAAGSVVTWKVLEAKYERIVQEEVDSVREFLLGDLEEEYLDEDEDEDSSYPDIPQDKPDLKEYAAKLAEMNYSNGEVPEKMEDYRAPYVISPEEYGDSDYETITVTYYADGVFVEDGFENSPYTQDDIEEAFGDIDVAEHFGEYEDDSVFIRREETETDYEILRVNENYHDLPSTMED